MQKRQTFSLYTDINSKLIEGLNFRPETIKLLKENIGSKLLDIGLGDNFLDLTPKPKAIKAKISGTSSNWEAASAQQRNPSTNWKSNL